MNHAMNHAMIRTIAVLTVWLVFNPATLLAAEVQPHEAFYDITVTKWNLPGRVASYSGHQILRLESSCTDWRIVGRFELSATMERSAEGNGGQSQNGRVKFESEISSTEAKDGNQFNFSQTTKMNGREMSRSAGTAGRATAGQAGIVVFEKPNPRRLTLPAEALFPVASFLFSAKRMEGGSRTANYILFDGSTPDPVRVFELATKQPLNSGPLPKGDTALLSGRGWRTVGSFHDYSGSRSEPLTTITQNIKSNGIATELTFDIGLAVVNLKLSAIRKLPGPHC
ncbi:MAG: DUF1849 family protein [Rhodospirillales bacterium]|nr:DUF1849 family protein [Rhodospirillales bacterium]